MNKIYPSAEAALEGLLYDGMTIMSGGFGLCGIPENLINAYLRATSRISLLLAIIAGLIILVLVYFFKLNKSKK